MTGRTRHLYKQDRFSWCGVYGIFTIVDKIREATCLNCLLALSGSVSSRISEIRIGRELDQRPSANNVPDFKRQPEGKLRGPIASGYPPPAESIDQESKVSGAETSPRSRGDSEGLNQPKVVDQPPKTGAHLDLDAGVTPGQDAFLPASAIDDENWRSI